MSFQNEENLSGEREQGNNAPMQQTFRSGNNQVVQEIFVPQPIAFTFSVQSTTYLTYMQLNYAQMTWLVPIAAYTFQTNEFQNIERYDSIMSTTAGAVQCLSFTTCPWTRDFYQLTGAFRLDTLLSEIRMTNDWVTYVYIDASMSIHSQSSSDAFNWRGFINNLYLEALVNAQHDHQRLHCFQETAAFGQYYLLSEVRMARQYSEVSMSNAQQENQNHKIDFAKSNYIKGQKSCRASYKKRRFQPYPRRVPSKYIKNKKTKSESNPRK